VLHLLDGLVVVDLLEDGAPPVLAHAGMNEVLVDPGELLAENLVQQIDDSWVAMHARRPSPALVG
jgi:hypothetical protein